ncbi:uncharacterized protein LOC141601771 [Silene latifolia]|uniref:uncharacterized protein LOC141601771 n=1 Tax=Silene latifolia TaxID=37657 RepID=UPI003D776377
MDSVSIVPVWVLFPDLDPFMWSEQVLSKMASTVGKPLFADLPTTHKSKLLFARVLVEVDVAGDLPTTVTVSSPYHGKIAQRIIYEWLLYYCHCCKKLGHTKEHCKFTKINKQLEEKKKALRVVQEFRPVANKNTHSSHSTEALDSECPVLGPDPPKVGAENPAGIDEKSSECIKLGSSSSILEDCSSLNDKEDGSECMVLGQQCSATVEKGAQEGMTEETTLADDLMVVTLAEEPPDPGEVRGYLFKNKIEVFGLLETRVKINNSAAIIRTFPTYSILHNYTHHYNGRIWVFLDTRKVTLISSYAHDLLLHLELLHNISNKVFHISFIYGSNDAGHIDRLWNELRGFVAKVTNWILLGDFNIVRAIEDKIGPNPPSITEILAFNQCLLDCTLEGMHSFGCEHTWTNKQDAETRVWSRLDKVVINSSWLVQYPCTQVNVLPSGISDHSPLLVIVQDNYLPKKKFSYLNCWEDHENYCEVVQATWEAPVRGSAMFRLFARLKNVRLDAYILYKVQTKKKINRA